jgi:hypothetical protein
MKQLEGKRLDNSKVEETTLTIAQLQFQWHTIYSRHHFVVGEKNHTLQQIYLFVLRLEAEKYAGAGKKGVSSQKTT